MPEHAPRVDVLTPEEHTAALRRFLAVTTTVPELAYWSEVCAPGNGEEIANQLTFGNGAVLADHLLWLTDQGYQVVIPGEEPGTNHTVANVGIDEETRRCVVLLIDPYNNQSVVPASAVAKTIQVIPGTL